MHHKIKVGFVLNNISNGGIESFFYNYLSNYKFSNEFEIYIIYSNNCNDEIKLKFEKLGVKIIKTNYGIDNNQIKYFFELIGFFYKYKFDVIHCNLMQNSLYPLIAGFISKIKNRIVHTHMNMSINIYDKSFNNRKKFIKKFKMLLCDIFSTKKIACSKIAGETSFKGNFEIIYNAIDISLFEKSDEKRIKIRKKLKINSNNLYAFFGRLYEEKNPLFAYKLFHEIKKTDVNAKMLFIGSGGLKEKMIELFKNNQDIIYIESVNDIQNYYQAIDLLIFPSLAEGLGMVAIEAQLMGVPVLASSGVPVETKISDYISYLSLSMGLNDWKDKALEMVKYNKNAINYNNNKDNYDIKKQSEKLFELYRKR